MSTKYKFRDQEKSYFGTFVLSPEEYVYSSVKNYAGDIDSILPVQFIE